MDYRELTNDSLTMLYESVRAALLSDNAQKEAGDKPRFRIRETRAWREHAGDLEVEMLQRGMSFEIIDWSEDQGQLLL